MAIRARDRKYPVAGGALLIRVAVMSLWVSLGLRLLRFSRLVTLLEGCGARRPQFKWSPEQVKAAVDRLSSPRLFVARSNCLKRSLLLYYFLLRSGCLGVELRIGVRKAGERLLGHSWILHDNSVFGDDPEFTSEFEVICARGGP